MSFLGRLSRAFNSLRSPKLVFDPSVFGDPLATEISWSPLAGGGTDSRTYEGVLVHPDRYEFRTSKKMTTSGVLGTILLIAIATFAVVMLPLMAILDNDNPNGMPLSLLLLFVCFSIPIVLFFAWLIWYIWRDLRKSIVFDRSEGWYWKGPTPPSDTTAFRRGKNACRLAEIHALQILSEVVRHTKQGSFTSWELNLVLTDGTRLDVVDHGSESDLVADARTLATFLSVPIWNKADALRPAPPSAP